MGREKGVFCESCEGMLVPHSLQGPGIPWGENAVKREELYSVEPKKKPTNTTNNNNDNNHNGTVNGTVNNNNDTTNNDNNDIPGFPTRQTGQGFPLRWVTKSSRCGTSSSGNAPALALGFFTRSYPKKTGDRCRQS